MAEPRSRDRWPRCDDAEEVSRTLEPYHVTPIVKENTVHTERQTKRRRGLIGVAAVWLSALALGVATGCGGSETAALPGSSPEEAQVPGQASAESEKAVTPYAGSCSKSIENGGHAAVARCSGYMNTGTFRVLTTCCISRCSGTSSGPWAFLAGGTSRASCGSGYATNVRIEFGPPGG